MAQTFYPVAVLVRPRFFWLAAVSACAGAASHTSASSHADPSVPARAHTLVVPALNTPVIMVREPDGSVGIVAGGVRVRIRGHEAEAAPMAFATAVRSVIAAPGGGYWFVSAAGTVARAPNFLGSLEVVRSLGPGVQRAVAFETGIAVLRTDGTVVRVGSSGPPLSAVSVPATAHPTPADAEQTLLVTQAVSHAFPLTRAILAGTVLLGSGEWAMQMGSDIYFAQIDDSGQLVGRGRVPAPTGFGADACVISAWGERALLACHRPDATTVGFVAQAGGLVPIAPPARGDLLPGREGHTLTRRGPCPDSPSDHPTTGFGALHDDNVTFGCTLDRDRPFREWQYPARARIVDVFDGMALIVDRTRTDGAYVLYHIDSAQGAPIELADPAATIARAGFTPDGHIIVLADSAAAVRRSMIGIAQPGEMVVLHGIGFHAVDVSMADARRGLVVGESARDVAETDDGGISWLHVPDIALQGDASAVSLEAPAPDAQPERAGTWLDCSPSICVAGRHLLHRWEAPSDVVPLVP